MSSVTPVLPETHATRSWSEHQDLHFARSQHVLPLLASELARTSHQFPAAFIEQQGQPRLAGVLGLRPGANLYITENGFWRGEILPLVLRSYPFLLGRSQHLGRDQRVLCVDHASHAVHDDTTGDHAFVNDQGQLTPATQARLKRLKTVEHERLKTQRAVQALHEAQLLTPWAIQIETEEGHRPLEGLLKVDETALNRLDDAAFVALRASGALTLAYGQLYSMPRLATVQRLHTRHLRDTQATAPENLGDHLDHLFGDNDDDLEFDFGP
ncbi:MAG: SapC family protein [Halomonas sp.]|nr:SapC family protein [Halomonas sp.]MBL1269840.1 SapC family protein [Halomonas sp.]